MRLIQVVATALAVLLVSGGCASKVRYPGMASESDVITTSTGLRYMEIVMGTGAAPVAGQNVVVHYTGYLLDSTKFDSSFDSGQPITFPIGTGYVIPGWDEGLMSMRAGGKRKLIIPSHLAYGERGFPGRIPPNSDLVFDVELMEVQDK